MKNSEIEIKLNEIHKQNYSLEQFDSELQKIKEEYVKDDNQEVAKQIWIYQTIIEIHKLIINAFNLLKAKDYYNGWCQLERIEITIGSLKKHFLYDKEQYKLWHIEKSVKNLQVIFPYRLFGSSELLKKKKKCSVCDKEISIRSNCGHIVGEIYNGEMCHRIVTDVEVLGMALVENPGNKFSVMFMSDEKTGEQIDQYNYDTVDYLFEHIENPYEFWDLEVSQRIGAKEDYGNVGRNEPCVCGSGKKFKKCCGLNIGKKYPHYEFIVRNPSSKTMITNTLKTK
ncbi:MAG TPA: zinc chelation protein SecC [Bacteroidales bacterium]|nr:zinc chelation protein SecC [Bacteroidales bacterium]